VLHEPVWAEAVALAADKKVRIAAQYQSLHVEELVEELN
jgi:hypothetical protein